jgi:GTP cyclohydrolase I
MAVRRSNKLIAEEALCKGVTQFMLYMSLDETDDSLKDTPARVAKMYAHELCWGLDYSNFPKCTTVVNKMGYNQVVVIKGIETLSLCEHHFQTISGYTHIGYIPHRHVLGLSKFARVTEFFARRPQVQERMTEQIHTALCTILGTDDVIVKQDCVHYCMKARGVRQNQASTITSKVGGRFLSNPAARKEFFDDIK